MSNLAILIFLVIFYIFVYKSYSSPKKVKSCQHHKHPRRVYASKHQCSSQCRGASGASYISDAKDASDQVIGLNEIEQDTQNRGYVPFANQPDHTGNLWKTDQSQINEYCDGSTKIHSYQADIHTPMREMALNQNLRNVSDMHLTSRFGCISS